MPVVLSGALPLTYPAALGLRTSYRPPPFALRRSGMLLPAAGAAVAARPAIWRAALPTNRTLMGKV